MSSYTLFWIASGFCPITSPPLAPSQGVNHVLKDLKQYKAALVIWPPNGLKFDFKHILYLMVVCHNHEENTKKDLDRFSPFNTDTFINIFQPVHI